MENVHICLSFSAVLLIPEIFQSLHCFGHTLVRFLIQLLSPYHLAERTLPLFDHTSACKGEVALLVLTDLHNAPYFAKPRKDSLQEIKTLVMERRTYYKLLDFTFEYHAFISF